MKTILIGALFLPAFISAQISSFPYRESFDTIIPPALPAGWSTTSNRNISGDFSTSASTARSAPNTVSSTDATKPQALISPYFSFTGKSVDSLEFYERRTASHTSGLLVEASAGSDTLFSIPISDTLKLVNSTSYIRRKLRLPPSLNNTDSVRFRWRVTGNGSGTTGVIRIDDIVLSVKKSVDLGISSITLSPVNPKKGDPVNVTVCIRNRALPGNFSGTLRLFDSLSVISSQIFNQTMAEVESVFVSILYPGITAGRHPLRVQLQVTADEDTSDNSVSAVVNAGYRFRTMLVNEIMYVPSSGMPEWIEIVNNGADTIPVAGWRISDATSNRAVIFPAHRSLPPHSYGIITTDTTALKNFYSISSPLFQASFSALNNGGDAVVLFDQTNSAIDSLTYAPSWGGSTAGQSLEKIDTAFFSTLQSNWLASRHPSGATPGMINSVTKKRFDAVIGGFSFSPSFPVAGTNTSVATTVKNAGTDALSLLQFQFFEDADDDSVLEEHELRFEQNISGLHSGDSVSIQATLPPLPQGTHRIAAVITALQDDDTSNNVLFAVLRVGLPPKSIVINEVMYAPAGDMPEWIEGYNAASSTVDIGGWKVSDNGSAKGSIQSPSTAVTAGQYFVITTDTNSFKNYFPSAYPLFQGVLPTLNNSSPDAVVLLDERGATMDSVFYRQSWGGSNGHSLQRFDIEGSSVDSANWRSFSPTPSTVNRSIRKNNDVRVKRIHSFPLFPIIGQQVSITTTIENIGKQSMNSIAVDVYRDADNDSIPAPSELLSQQIIPSLGALDSVSTTVHWTPDRSGMHRIFVKITAEADEETANNVGVGSVSAGAAPTSIVINEIMYDPPGDNPEWIECYNKSMTPVSIAGWKLSDNGTTRTTIANNAITIPSGMYFIVTSDSSFFLQYAGTVPVLVAPFSSLNNTTPDAVVLFDDRLRTIDTVYYRPLWGGKNGQSLQRIDLFSPSTDSADWKSAVPTAGVENIVARKDYDVEIQQSSAAKISNGSRITATVKNSGRRIAQSIRVKFYYDANRDSIAQTDELLQALPIDAIAPLDTSVVSFDWSISFQGSRRMIVVGECAEDERPENNTGTVMVVNSYPARSIVINEIMYEPSSGNAEFVELLNRSNDTIDVAKWRLMDQPNSSGSRAIIALSNSEQLIAPNDYLLVASDSSIFSQYTSIDTHKITIDPSLSLSNSGEDLVLIDLTNTQIDSLRYSPSWHLRTVSTSGRSLERIDMNGSSVDPRNWSSSVTIGGATPAQKNSVFIGSIAPASAMTLTPNPFSPDQDGYEDFLSINHSLPSSSSTIRVRIYDVAGRLIRRLANGEPAPSSGSLIWNGLDDDGHRVRIGMYIILFEAFDNFGGTVKTMKDVAVVARKL